VSCPLMLTCYGKKGECISTAEAQSLIETEATYGRNGETGRVSLR